MLQAFSMVEIDESGGLHDEPFRPDKLGPG